MILSGHAARRFEITDGVTFFDEFEKPPQVPSSIIAPHAAPGHGQVSYAKYRIDANGYMVL